MSALALATTQLVSLQHALHVARAKQRHRLTATMLEALGDALAAGRHQSSAARSAEFAELAERHRELVEALAVEIEPLANEFEAAAEDACAELERLCESAQQHLAEELQAAVVGFEAAVVDLRDDEAAEAARTRKQGRTEAWAAAGKAWVATTHPAAMEACTLSSTLESQNSA